MRGRVAVAAATIVLGVLFVVPPDPVTRLYVSAGPPPLEGSADPSGRVVPGSGRQSPSPPPTVVVGRAPKNVRVTRDGTPGSYRRADGATDATMLACSTGRREQNEPAVAVDPSNPKVVVIAANDYCAAMTSGDAWLGLYRSTDGGRTWIDSLVPGYPTDGSAAGQASPAHGRCSVASDPTVGFDAGGRLFVGFICFDRAEKRRGEAGLVGSSTFVARYEDHGARYVGTTLVSRGTPDRNEDKINMTVDPTRGRFGGNVYAAWVQLAEPTEEGFPRDPLLFARSRDHGKTFSKPFPVSELVHARFPDVTVGPDGSVYAAFRSGTTLWIARSTDGARTFQSPVQIAASLVPFDSSQFSAGSGDDCGVGRLRCHSGLVFSRFDTQVAVAVDEAGVHAVWNERVGGGQSKLMVRNSPNGVTWSPPVQIDRVAAGHQYFPDVVSGAGVITVAFYDSRNDPAYAPLLPPGNTAEGKSSGGAVDVYVAQSRDGGRSWTERRITTRSSNFNYLSPGNLPFWGDYLYASAAGPVVQVAWTDSRNFKAKRKGSFAGDNPCGTKPFVNDPCLSAGGSDQNIYTARL
ncbi:MAG: sialidase family protein [Actinomycetota bacterium]